MIRLVAVSLLLLAAPGLAQFPASWPVWSCPPETWVRCTEIFIPRDNPTSWQARGAGAYLAFPNVGITGQEYGVPPNTWTTLDLARLGVPRDARAVFLHTLMIVTHGTTGEIVAATVSFRRPGATADNRGSYHTQVCEAHVGGGQRTTDALWCPVEDGRIDIYWSPQRSVNADWPTGSALGLSIVVNAWAR